MKKTIFCIVLLVFFVTISKAQCIEQLAMSTNPDEICDVINSNVSCLRETLNRNEYRAYKVKINYLYTSSYPWVYHTNPEKEKLFNNFYDRFGYLYPSLISAKPTNPEFYQALKEIIATDPNYFKQVQETKIPIKYIQWMRVKGMCNKFGDASIVRLMQSASKIVNY